MASVDDEILPSFTEAKLADLLQRWTPDQIAAAGVSRECIAACMCFFGRMDDYGDPRTYQPQFIIKHTRTRVAEDAGYDV
jgi:hypothetical protein